jgi:hypothetical protein
LYGTIPLARFWWLGFSFFFERVLLLFWSWYYYPLCLPLPAYTGAVYVWFCYSIIGFARRWCVGGVTVRKKSQVENIDVVYGFEWLVVLCMQKSISESQWVQKTIKVINFNVERLLSLCKVVTMKDASMAAFWVYECAKLLCLAPDASILLYKRPHARMNVMLKIQCATFPRPVCRILVLRRSMARYQTLDMSGKYPSPSCHLAKAHNDHP